MSFWDDIKNFTKPYDANDDYDDYDDDMDEGFEEEAPAPRFGSRREASASAAAESPFSAAASAASTGAFSSGATTATGFSGQVVTPSSNKQQLVLVRPTTFNDAPDIAANLRAKKAVVLNLEGVEKNLACRVVDFLSGCTYCLDGSVKKVSQATYLFCPHNMEVLGDLKNLQGEVENYL